MVEPIAGIIGALAVNVTQSILSYALSFAAGSMIYVVCENLIPEGASHGNGKLSTWCCLFGFCIMLCLDVGFG
jgi:zinc transporter ZupT